MSVIIIYPTELYSESPSELNGAVNIINNCVYFYILNKFPTRNQEYICNIGLCQHLKQKSSNDNKTLLNKCGEVRQNWIELIVNDQSVDIARLFVNDEEYNVESMNVTFVQYNRCSFLQSKLLNYSTQYESSSEDCFQLLQKYCDLQEPNYDTQKTSALYTAVIIESLQKILNVCRILKIFTFSSLYNHFTSVLENMVWCLQSVQARKHKLKLMNYASSILLDVLFGVYLLHCFHSLIHTQEELFSFVSTKCEAIVGSLHQLVVWLQGNPAGLKLNHPLTFLLGKFYIYYIQLWWSFLILARPLLEFIYPIFLCIGYCGFTVQLCIISDLLTLASFHVYCIYVYAAKLYNIQLQSLRILTRVFVGKKRNPEPGKVDSVPYTTEQLFIGTLAFTVLLFLLPTTLVYYVVFTSIRLLIICVEGILNRIKLYFQTLPVYVTLLYLLKSPQTTSTIKLTPLLAAGMNRGRVHILASPVHQSLLKTVEMSIPDPLNTSQPVPWRQLLSSVTTGKLIYPM